MIEAPSWRPTAREYHADREHWSPSMFAVFRESPALAWGRFVARRWPAPEPTSEMILGSAVNAALLDLWEATVYVVPVETRGCRTFREAQRGWPDRLVLTQSEANVALEAAAAVREPRTRSAEVARALLVDSQGVSEWARRWIDPIGGLPCKQMIDRLAEVGGRPAIVELKTSGDPAPRAFRQSIRRFGYDWQASFNARGVKLALGEQPNFYFVVVRSSPPFEVGVYLTERDEVARKILDVEEMIGDVAAARSTSSPWCSEWERLEDGQLPRVEFT